MKKNISNLITFVAVASVISSASADGLAFSKQNNVDQIYFGFTTSHAFQTSAKSDAVEKKSGYKSKLPNFDASIAKYITDSYRIEFAAGFRKFSYNNSLPQEISQSQDISIYRFMLNNYYDLTTINEKFTPYVMAGIGISHIKPGKFKEVYGSEGSTEVQIKYNSATNLSYQFGLGMDVKLSENSSLDFGVRHVNYGSIKANDSHHRIKLKSNEILAGIKFNF